MSDYDLDLDGLVPPPQRVKLRGVEYQIHPIFSLADRLLYEAMTKRLEYEREYRRSITRVLAEHQLAEKQAMETGEQIPSRPELPKRDPDRPLYTEEQYARDVKKLLLHVWQGSDAAQPEEMRFGITLAKIEEMLTFQQCRAAVDHLWQHQFDTRAELVTETTPAPMPTPNRAARRRGARSSTRSSA